MKQFAFLLALLLSSATHCVSNTALSPSNVIVTAPPDKNSFIQAAYSVDDGIWILVRSIAARQVALRHVTWSGSVTEVVQDVGFSAISVAPLSSDQLSITHANDTLEVRSITGAMIRSTKLPKASNLQAFVNGKLITATSNDFGVTDPVSMITSLHPQNWIDIKEHAVYLLPGVSGSVFLLSGTTCQMATWQPGHEVLTEVELEASIFAESLAQYARNAGGRSLPEGTSPPKPLLVAGAGTDNLGNLYLVMSPSKANSTRLVQIAPDGSKLAELFLDFSQVPTQKRGVPKWIFGRGNAVYALTGTGYLFTFPTKR